MQQKAMQTELHISSSSLPAPISWLRHEGWNELSWIPRLILADPASTSFDAAVVLFYVPTLSISRTLCSATRSFMHVDTDGGQDYLSVKSGTTWKCIHSIIITTFNYFRRAGLRRAGIHI